MNRPDEIAQLTAKLAETLRTDTTDAGYAEASDAADDLVRLVRAVVRDELRRAGRPTPDTARPCCYTETGPCATCRNGGPIGGCCRPLRNVCPTHH